MWFGRTLEERELAETEGFVSETGNLKGEVLKAEGIEKAVLYLASAAAAHYVSGLNLFFFGSINKLYKPMQDQSSRITKSNKGAEPHTTDKTKSQRKRENREANMAQTNDSNKPTI